MDDGTGVVLAVGFAFIVGLLSGLIGYESGRDSARDQARAAKVGRYVAEAGNGRATFEWGCEIK